MVMIKDDAREWTDKKLARMERHIERIYREAGKDIYIKWQDYLNRANAKIAPLQQQYDDARKEGNKDLTKKIGAELAEAKRKVTIRNDYYQSMLDEVTHQLTDVNQTALAYISGEFPKIYTTNYNQMVQDVNNLNIGIKFNMRNQNVVRQMIMQNEIQLPKKKVNVPKDLQWNKKHINNAVRQGILQGESIPKIAKRLMPIMGNNKNVAVRNARTMVTGVENKGRLDSYEDARDRGIESTKVWIATGDSRTRDWHLDMDGQEVGIDEPFIDGNGNELMYPGDPDAAPETVWNCRCSMRTSIKGYHDSGGNYHTITYRETGVTRHEAEIENERQSRRGK